MFQRIKILCFVLVVVTLGCTGCIHEKEPDWEGANLQPGDALPEFSVVLNNGTTLSSKSLQGKVAVILLFTVTCPDCQAQFADTERIYEEYAAHEQVIIFGISREEGESVVGEYWKRNHFRMPYSAQENRFIYSLFARSGVPRIYIANGERIIQALFTDHRKATYDPLKEAIESVLLELNAVDPQSAHGDQEA